MAVMFQPPPQTPIIVRIVEEPVRETTVVDVLLGALGLTGVLLLVALAAGALFGGLFILFRKMQAHRTPYTGKPGDVPRII
jgi:hypothetical protein